MSLMNSLWTSMIISILISLNSFTFCYPSTHHNFVTSQNQENQYDTFPINEQQPEQQNDITDNHELASAELLMGPGQQMSYETVPLTSLTSEDVRDYPEFKNELEHQEETNLVMSNILKKLEQDIQEEQEIVTKSAVLMKILENPNIETLPIVYVEEAPPETIYDQLKNLIPIQMENSEFSGIEKRSRYYRRYPWKRHSRNRGTYEPEARYLCVPSKHDVLKLLVELHETRLGGNNQKTVNFCNRRRPAKKVFTSTRFLG